MEKNAMRHTIKRCQHCKELFAPKELSPVDQLCWQCEQKQRVLMEQTPRPNEQNPKSCWVWVHPDREAILATLPKDTQPTVGPCKRVTRPDGLAHAATVFETYTHDRFDRSCAPPSYCNIYTPDGGVLRALTEAEAARICSILNGED